MEDWREMAIKDRGWWSVFLSSSWQFLSVSGSFDMSIRKALLSILIVFLKLISPYFRCSARWRQTQRPDRATGRCNKIIAFLAQRNPISFRSLQATLDVELPCRNLPNCKELVLCVARDVLHLSSFLRLMIIISAYHPILLPLQRGAIPALIKWLTPSSEWLRTCRWELPGLGHQRGRIFKKQEEGKKGKMLFTNLEMRLTALCRHEVAFGDL